MSTKEKNNLLQSLWTQGESVAAIAKQLGLRPANVRHMAWKLRKAGVKLKRRTRDFNYARIGGIFRSYGIKVRLP